MLKKITENNCKQPRQNWNLAFKKLHQNGSDVLLIPDMLEDEDWLQEMFT